MFRKPFDWVKNQSIGKKIGLGVVGSFLAIGIAGAAMQPPVPSKPDSAGPTVQTQPKVEHKTETTTEEVAFQTVTQDDPSLEVGQTAVAVQGSNGTKTLVWDVTYTDGKPGKKELASESVTTSPTNKVVKNGTKPKYVAPVSKNCGSGYYLNVDGDCIESPSSSDDGVATGVCNDGSYTYAVHHQGACSHHGGVDYWL